MATLFTLVKYITDSTISQVLKNSRNGIKYTREYPVLIQNILIQGVSSDLLFFPQPSFISIGCIFLLFNPTFLMSQIT